MTIWQIIPTNLAAPRQLHLFPVYPVSFSFLLLHLLLCLLSPPSFSASTSWSCISSSGWSRDKRCPQAAALVWPYGSELCVLCRRTCCTPTTLTTQRPCSWRLEGEQTEGGEHEEMSENEPVKDRQKITCQIDRKHFCGVFLLLIVKLKIMFISLSSVVPSL